MRRTETPEPIWIKFCTVVDIADVVPYTNFGDHRLRVFWVAVGQISPSPIDFHRRPYNTLALPCERVISAFSALTLLVGWQEGHPACKKTEGWGAGMVICLEQGADLHMARLMPLPLTVSCFSKIQIGFTFLVLAHLGSPRAFKWVCVC